MKIALLLGLVTVLLFSERPWIIDGDTLDYDGQRIRIANLDAPEIGGRSRCKLERERGYAAKEYAIAIVKRGREFEVYDFSHIDRFGRTVAKLKVDGRDFGELMIRAGKARRWEGRTSNWC